MPIKKKKKVNKVLKKKVEKKITKSSDPVFRSRRTANVPVNIKVFGVGGGGGNAISRMKESFNTRVVELIAVNTDIQDLQQCPVRRKIHIGKKLTRGLGAGMDPDLGKRAAEESREEIAKAVEGADMVFITAGLGGGTGSGAAPVIAEIAKNSGALTIGIVTKPFVFEGTQRSRIADEAMFRLKDKVDALIVVPNDKIFTVIKKDTPILKAFKRIDEVLRDSIAGISELISATGIVNVDYADVQTIMREAGSALIGVGYASGKNRAIAAATQAVNSPLLEFSIEGARGILFGISGSRDLSMSEINEIANSITATIDPAAKIIFGAYHDRSLGKGKIKVTLIATGFNDSLPRRREDSRPSVFFNEVEAEYQEEIRDDRQASFMDVLSKKPEINEEVSVEVEIEEDEEEKPKTKELEETSNSDIWEIPAFLRKKRR